MLLHYWKTGRRFLARHLSFSLINILGLSVGLASCLLIYRYVHFELSYDRYNTKFDRIVRVTTILHSPETNLSMAVSPIPMAGMLLRNDPALESAVRVEPTQITVKKGVELFKEDDFCYSEQSLFSVFSFSFLEGLAAGALTGPDAIVLTRAAARKYFGDAPALGKTLTCNGREWRVTAVVADQPLNSDLPMHALLSKDFSKATHWVIEDLSVYTFLLFRGKPDLRRLAGQLSALSSKYIQPELDEAGAKGYHVSFESEPLADLHFSQGKQADTPKGSRSLNTIFSALAAFILIIALLNYINLSTARAIERAKEVAIRKTIGARPVQLIRQFLGESFFLLGLAWLIAIGLMAAGIPFLNRALSIHLSLGGWQESVFLVLLFPVTALLAGIYPAFVLSRFSPLQALKGSGVRTGGKGGAASGVGLRKVLTVVQFIIAMAMLTGTVVIYTQMRFIDHKDLGADRSQIASLALPSDTTLRAGSEAFCQALRKETGVKGLSVGSGLPTEGVAMSSTTAYSGGKKREFLCDYFSIDPQFLPLLHISLLEGRNFSDDLPTDRKEGFIVNEAFVKTMGWRSALGQSLEGWERKGSIIGVTKNFFYKSLHNTIAPMVLIYKTDLRTAVLVKTQPQVLSRLKGLWQHYFPSLPFDYSFMDESFNQQYKQDRITLLLFNVFTGLAIFISCLGLYGLVSLMTVQRTKEIGVRKVLGASLGQLVALFTTDLVKLVGWAMLVALPLAGIGMTRWLSTYAYHTSLNAWMFILPVAILLALALMVTSLRIIRTALVNPVKSLRAE